MSRQKKKVSAEKVSESTSAGFLAAVEKVPGNIDDPLVAALRDVARAIREVGVALISAPALGLAGQTRDARQDPPTRELLRAPPPNVEAPKKQEPKPEAPKKQEPKGPAKASLADAQRAVSALMQAKTVSFARTLLRERFHVERVSDIGETKENAEEVFALVVAACEEALK